MSEFSLLMPLWTGVAAKRELPTLYPFSLGLHANGYIVQTTPADVVAKVVARYASDEYNYMTKPPGLSAWADELGKFYLDYLDAHLPDVRGKNVLEIGAGTTYFAEKLVERGAASYIIYDPSARETSDNPHITVKRDYFSLNTPMHDIDIVISMNTLEHIPEPKPLLEHIAKHLRPGGLAIFIFPDIEDQFSKGDLNALSHEHVNYFTKASATHLFQSSGFGIVHWKSENDTHFFVLNATAEKPATINEQQFLNRSTQHFERSIAYAKREILPAVQRGTVAFHGATNGLNIVLSVLGLSENKHVVIFDGDASKTGEYLPSACAPVRGSADSSYASMHTVFVSAMTYYEPIKRFIMKTHHIPETAIHPYYPVSHGDTL